MFVEFSLYFIILLTSSNNQISEFRIPNIYNEILKPYFFHKKINKKVNKQNIWNSENLLFDDVSEIQINKICKNNVMNILLLLHKLLIVLKLELYYSGPNVNIFC